MERNKKNLTQKIFENKILLAGALQLEEFSIMYTQSIMNTYHLNILIVLQEFIS